MKKKILIIIIFLFIIGGIIFYIFYNNKINGEEQFDSGEYVPQEEINDKQLRETIITLYFVERESKIIKSEGRLIDSSELLNNPYKLIVQYLLDGPESENLEKCFPEKTRIIDVSIEKNCVVLNFSEEILNYEDDTQKYNIINCILNSLTQLNEVNSIRFLINGEVKSQLNEEYCEIR